MAEIKIAGIMRAPNFSPNHIGNDAAILNHTADQLRKRGCTVNIYTEEQFVRGEVTEHIILNMCREPRSIALLQQREDDGDLVINSGYGIENCQRERMSRILRGSSIPVPESIVADTDEVVKRQLTAAGFADCWVKRADMHAQHQEDVSYARHPQEAQEILQEYFLRGIRRAIICRHLKGELVKFYGVAGTPFFHWFFHFDSPADRRGDDTAARAAHPALDVDRFRAVCTRAAEILDVTVFGGDAIVSDDGSFHIIDFKDWPSFAPFRSQVAPVIARMVMARIKKHFNND